MNGFYALRHNNRNGSKREGSKLGLVDADWGEGGVSLRLNGAKREPRSWKI
mgnify:CR=1 FL=1